MNSLAYSYLMNDQTDEARAILRDLVGEGQTAVYVAATKGLLKLHDNDVQGGRDGYEEAMRLAYAQGNERLALVAQQKMHLELARAYFRDGWLSMARREVEEGIETGDDLNEEYLRDLRGLEVGLSRDQAQHK